MLAFAGKTRCLSYTVYFESTRSHESSRAGPVERNVLARIGRPLELVAKGIDRADCRFAPGHDLTGSGLGAGRVDQLRIFPGQACRSGQRLGPGLDLAGDLGSPMRAVGGDLERDMRALDAADLPAFGGHRGDESRKSAGLAAEDPRRYFGLAVVGALVDKDAGR